MPIGNLTSQLFANVYLDQFDHFVSEVLRAPYLRYVDDFALFAGEPVRVDDADPRVVEQGRHGRSQRLGPYERLPDADELPDVGQQVRDRRDPRRAPTVRVDGVAEAPGDRRAVRPVEPGLPVWNRSCCGRARSFFDGVHWTATSALVDEACDRTGNVNCPSV